MTPLKFLLILCISFFVVCTVLVIIAYSDVAYGLPSLEQLENPRQNFASQVFSSDGELLDHFFIQRRVSLPIDSIPKAFINALVATEDRRFYSHWGIHTGRILKAIVKNIFWMKAKEGGSTITMQLARNLYFNQEFTLRRKIREAITAVQIEKTFTKSEILEMYSNTVNFGRGAYGIQVASQVYFDKSPMELTTSECAFLVGLLKAPEHYNGVVDYDRALERRNLVLHLMYNQDYLTSSQYFNAIEEPITLSRNRLNKRGTYLVAPHFVELIRQQLSKDPALKDYDLYRDGLIIYTTLNAKIQKYAKEAIEEHFAEFQKTFTKSFSWANNRELLDDLIKKAIRSQPEYTSSDIDRKKTIENELKRNRTFIDSVKNAATTVQVGLVVMDPSNGEVLAMVGASPKFMAENHDAKYSLNHVTQIRRQPGSSFKPFTYASAIEEGMDPNSLIECGPYTYKLLTGEVWSPGGSCEGGGSVNLFQGLAQSINTVAARLITKKTTPEKVVALAKRMGIQTQLQAVPALALGAGGEVAPFEMAQAFSTFANDGVRQKPYEIKRIEDQFGNTLYSKNKSEEVYDAMKPKLAHLLTSMMQGVVDHGTAREIRNYFTDCDAAGKTGTTNDFADAWFVGYTPQLVCCVWVGCDDRRVTFTGGYGYAGKAAAPIFGRLMAKIYKDPSLPFKQKRFTFLMADSTDSLFQKKVISAASPTKLEKRIAEKPNNEGKNLIKDNNLRKISSDNPEKKDYKFPKLNKNIKN